MQLPDREQIESLPAVTIVRWVGIGALVVCLPYQIAMGLAAAVGLHTVSWGGAPITGLSALWTAPLIGLAVAVLLTVCFSSAFLAARWIFSQMNEDLPEEDETTASPETRSEVRSA